MDIYEQALELHKKLHGKIHTQLRAEVTMETLKLLYSPGVSSASTYAKNSQTKLAEVSWTNNLVAVISDGSSVLGLGDIGPEGAMPVMEGKSLLFKHFADIDSVPIVLNVHTADEIVKTISAIAPSFGAINLEDIAAPLCFEVENRLVEQLDIPVMHDDQHGTAIVVLAGIINAMKVVKKELSACKVVLLGTGAAGVGVAKLLHEYSKCDIISVDSKGIIEGTRQNLNSEKQLLLTYNRHQTPGTLQNALENADIFIGVSAANLLKSSDISLMNNDPVIFALSNPEPEINPDVALSAGAAIVATGRSDYKNQINNYLAFPGVFRGALDNKVKKITSDHKIAAAKALAGLVTNPSHDKIIPGPFDAGVMQAVANSIQP